MSVDLQIFSKIVGPNFFKNLFKFRGTPPPTFLNRRRGIFQDLPQVAELFRTVQKLRQSVHRFSRNLGGKVFLFGPLAAERRTAGGANSSELWQKWSSFRVGNLVKIGRSAAEIFEVKRKSNFPVQNMKIRYAPPPVYQSTENTIDRVV